MAGEMEPNHRLGEESVKIHWQNPEHKAPGKVELGSQTPLVKKVKGESAASTQERKEELASYLVNTWGWKNSLANRRLTYSPPHQPTDCAIEILPGVKLLKPRLYSMTPRELEELRAFIDKNLPEDSSDQQNQAWPPRCCSRIKG